MCARHKGVFKRVICILSSMALILLDRAQTVFGRNSKSAKKTFEYRDFQIFNFCQVLKFKPNKFRNAVPILGTLL